MPEGWVYDQKGWTVFTQEGDAVTELAPDGFGGFDRLGELGQTFSSSCPPGTFLNIAYHSKRGAVNRPNLLFMQDFCRSCKTYCPKPKFWSFPALNTGMGWAGISTGSFVCGLHAVLAAPELAIHAGFLPFM